ncbi:TetR/AcrR family transcriptional regulator [Streptomyces formicae]|uniref:TetR/AcrR family transcriptional regulator n=1 Tax=Streptomyces formicae TaxID=1616117 RepID=A0ABY3WJU9_9ACTN|nr:TetR/AcrR family transcriptional regulator [Streptomyces formicae]UNM12883.1 TetR/AcrR family transcriptional regulator [Streptomyces formicae]
MAEPANEPVRADALRNREHILQVAHDAFAESGTTSLNAIAKRAGVGPGTLYRHFPTREDLILAVYRHDVRRLVDSVPDVLAAARTPLDAFRTWFRTLADYVRLKHGLGEALHTAAVQDAVNETYAPVTAAVARLLRACEEDGSVRPGLDAADTLLLMGFLWRVGPGEEGREQARRLMELAIAGLRPVPGAAGPVPGPVPGPGR